MNSKSFQSFDGKVRSLNQHLQLLDLALTMSNAACTKKEKTVKTMAEALQSNLHTHPQLNIPNLPKDIKRTFTTSRKKANEQALIELYAYFSEYLSSIIRELEGNDPKRVISLIPGNGEFALKYVDIFNMSSYDDILDEIAKRVYRSLENEKSTSKLLDKIIKTMKLGIQKELKEDALVYLEVRHLIIHSSSKADDRFNALNKRNLVKVNKSNHLLSINYLMVSASIAKVLELCKAMDDELVSKGLLKERL